VLTLLRVRLKEINTVIATVTDEETWKARIPGPAMNELRRIQMKDEHRRLTNAGWSYRTSDRGWVIYQNPQAGSWHTLKEALSIMRSAIRVAYRPQ